MKLRKYVGSIYKRVLGPLSYQFGIYRRKGAYFLLNKKSMMDETIIKFKHYEEDMIDYASKIITEDQLTHVIDIGSNLGYYTVRLGKIPTIKKVVSFEPLPSLYIQMSSNVLINALIDKWQGYNLALSDHSGKATLYYHPFFLGTSSLNKDWTERASHRVEVDVRAFDEVIEISGEHCFVKIDVEGSEISVLKGMKRFLSTNKAFIQVETTGDRLDEITSILNKEGYSLKGNPFKNDYYFSNY